ncbi:pirin family protein [Cupriavidus plantarum]|uniref:Redox-sensitive bicupin YhaK (Pirin superfamily) n=1 Tax=Cupriavidus plantarum TaxID=942865 RepID=A0A316ERJ6_9BURK|nr:pirin family protein [Cupriavidus plantarum]PWK34156.1 redox-sensitive bicupin YhaK (pirin superfamily) [Cupriavidus plantarum]
MSLTAEAHHVQRRAIAHRTHGRKNGPAVRLMSPSDLGQFLKPFVFLDFFDMQGPPFVGPLHPHSGIATLSFLIDGRMDLIDPDGNTVVLPSGGIEWMQAGKGMWHGGSVGDSDHGRVRGYQLWVALPPNLELGPTVAAFQGTGDIAGEGAARVLLGSYGHAHSAIAAPSPMNVLAVTLKAGERWTYQPPPGQTVLWVSPAEGQLLANGEALYAEELIAFERSHRKVDFEAVTDTQFILGSAVPHEFPLSLGYYSVHTSPSALRIGEDHIDAIGRRLLQEGRIGKM